MMKLTHKDPTLMTKYIAEQIAEKGFEKTEAIKALIRDEVNNSLEFKVELTPFTFVDVNVCEGGISFSFGRIDDPYISVASKIYNIDTLIDMSNDWRWNDDMLKMIVGAMLEYNPRLISRLKARIGLLNIEVYSDAPKTTIIKYINSKFIRHKDPDFSIPHEMFDFYMIESMGDKEYMSRMNFINRNSIYGIGPAPTDPLTPPDCILLKYDNYFQILQVNFPMLSYTYKGMIHESLTSKFPCRWTARIPYPEK